MPEDTSPHNKCKEQGPCLPRSSKPRSEYAATLLKSLTYQLEVCFCVCHWTISPAARNHPLSNCSTPTASDMAEPEGRGWWGREGPQIVGPFNSPQRNLQPSHWSSTGLPVWLSTT